MLSDKNNKTLSLDEQEVAVAKILKRLLRAKGIKKHIRLDTIDEASEVLPGGIYPVSGVVLTDENKLYTFWIGWDEPISDYELGESDGYWSEVPLSDYSEYEEKAFYLLARKRLNLPYNTSLVHKEREGLSNNVIQHGKDYPPAITLPQSINEKFQKILNIMEKWNDVITNWVNFYLKDTITFSEADLKEAGFIVPKLVNTFCHFGNETGDESYNIYIRWASSLLDILGKLEIIANLEGKVETVFIDEDAPRRVIMGPYPSTYSHAKRKSTTNY